MWQLTWPLGSACSKTITCAKGGAGAFAAPATCGSAEKGADGPDRLGPVRAVSAGLISAAAMKRAMIAAFAVATAFGVYLAWVGGWPVVAIGVASIASGIAYTGGPWPLGYHGLGDVFVMIFFGFVAVCGTAYVQLGHVPCLAICAALP